MSYIPAKAVEAAQQAMWEWFAASNEVGTRAVLAAALPHIRGQWLAEVKPAIERLTPCRCDPAYTERGLHQSDCLLEIREDVLDVLGAGKS